MSGIQWTLFLGVRVIMGRGMKRHCFVIIRYSLLAGQNTREWRLLRQNKNKAGEILDTYEDNLFSPKRLSAHAEMFERFTLPSLIGDADNYTVGVFISERLPAVWKQRLKERVSAYSNVEVVELPPVEDFASDVSQWIKGKSEIFSENVAFATIRLDDDDALGRSYFDYLYKYLAPEYSGMCVSFPSGYRGAWKAGKLVGITRTYLPKTAQGLAHINYFDASVNRTTKSENIFTFSSHRRLDRHFPVVLDAREPLFIRSVHSAQDTVPFGFQKLWRKVQEYAEEPCSYSEICDHFFVDAELFALKKTERIPWLQRVAKKIWAPGQ